MLTGRNWQVVFQFAAPALTSRFSLSSLLDWLGEGAQERRRGVTGGGGGRAAGGGGWWVVIGYGLGDEESRILKLPLQVMEDWLFKNQSRRVRAGV
jgi:hypothetical protein